MSKSKNAVQYRQGDCFLKKVDSLPKGKLKKVGIESGRVILLRGERTLHHHSVTAIEEEAVLYTDENGKMWLEAKQDTDLTHQEHATIPVQEGFYEVIQQKEYHPNAVRNVAD